MPSPDWKQVLETGQEYTEMTRSRAREIANRLVEQGQLAQSQVSNAVEELMAQSRRRTAHLRALIDERIQAQFRMLGVATRADLDRLEQRLIAEQKKAVARKPAAKKAAKASTRKSTTTARASATKKAAAT